MNSEKDQVGSSWGPPDYDAGGNRPLTTVQYSIPPRIVKLVLGSAGGKADGEKNILDPLTVECSTSTEASFKLAFNLVLCLGCPMLSVEVLDMDVADFAIRIKATVEWYSRPRDANITIEEDKSRWPAPETPVKVTLDGEGRIGSFYVNTLRALTVHLEVYAVDACLPFSAVLGGLNALRLEKTLTDVELRVGDEVFHAHRAVLAANSPVFSSMFTSDLKETKEGVVEIKGTTPTAFGLFLRFLYAGTVGDWKGCELELLELADRYLVSLLEAVCQGRLREMGWSTALAILRHADNPIVSSDVRMRAARVVVKNWDAVMVAPEWIDFQAACPVLADLLRAAQLIDAERAASLAKQPESSRRRNFSQPAGRLAPALPTNAYVFRPPV